MLTNVKSPHFCYGGTGITNFDPSDLPDYEEAIRRHGNPGYVVSQHPMDGNVAAVSAGLQSLHYIGLPWIDIGDSGPFWRVYDEVREERKRLAAPISITLTRAQAEALMTVLYCCVTGKSSTTARGRTDEVFRLLRDAGVEAQRHHKTSGRVSFEE